MRFKLLKTPYLIIEIKYVLRHLVCCGFLSGNLQDTWTKVLVIRGFFMDHLFFMVLYVPKEMRKCKKRGATNN